MRSLNAWPSLNIHKMPAVRSAIGAVGATPIYLPTLEWTDGVSGALLAGWRRDPARCQRSTVSGC